MVLNLKKKPEWDSFIKTCTPLAIVDVLENEMRRRVDAITEALLGFNSTDAPQDNLARFLKADADFLGIALALVGLSQEKFLRILSAERFSREDFGKEWNIKTIRNKLLQEQGFAESIADLFMEGSESQLLVERVADFYREQLALADNWETLIRDPQLVRSVIRAKLMGEYIDKKGDAIENLIRAKLDEIRAEYGVHHEKGQVRLVGGKEVDHVLPSTDEPYVMIMTSYMETTSSAQTARANEQREMYLKIQDDNMRYNTKRILVNVVDGGGWLARRSDLRKLYNSCDYILNLKTLDQLEAIICFYVPEQYFVNSKRPKVSEA